MGKTNFKKIRNCVLLFSLMLCACNAEEQQTITTIQLSAHEEELFASSVLQEQHYTLLEAMGQESVISSIKRVLCADDLCFIVDTDRNKITSFDYNGKFISSTSHLIGHATNEYLHIQDAAIDIQQKRIYLHCDSPYQMMILDYDLNVKETIKLEEFFREFTLDSEFIYALCPDLTNESRYELRKYRKENITGDYDILVEQNHAIARARGLGKHMNGNGRSTYVCMPFDNTLYEITSGKIKRFWKLDFSGKWFDYEQNKNLMGYQFTQANPNVLWSVQNIIASDTAVLFNTNLSDLFMASLNTGIGASYSSFTNDSIPFSNSWLLPTSGKYDVTFAIPATQIAGYKEWYLNQGTEIPKTPIRHLIEKVEGDGNPLLIFGKMK